MNNSQSKSYAAAGVDITAGYKSVELMKSHIVRTKTPGCLDDVGGFGGCFGLDLKGIEEPVLVSGTDGVGTKIKLAMLLDRHNTIGIDCVAMCVNDIICCGAKPLFFLDYIACGKNHPEKIAEIVSGVAAVSYTHLAQSDDSVFEKRTFGKTTLPFTVWGGFSSRREKTIFFHTKQHTAIRFVSDPVFCLQQIIVILQLFKLLDRIAVDMI